MLLERVFAGLSSACRYYRAVSQSRSPSEVLSRLTTIHPVMQPDLPVLDGCRPVDAKDPLPFNAYGTQLPGTAWDVDSAPGVGWCSPVPSLSLRDSQWEEIMDDYTRLHRQADSVSFGGPFPLWSINKGRRSAETNGNIVVFRSDCAVNTQAV